MQIRLEKAKLECKMHIDRRNTKKERKEDMMTTTTMTMTISGSDITGMPYSCNNLVNLIFGFIFILTSAVTSKVINPAGLLR